MKIATKENTRTLKLADLRVRDAENDGKKISGYALKFNEPSEDLGGFIEYIKTGALDEVNFSQVLLVYAHDFNKILARADSGTLTTKIDDTGLYFEATLADTTLANDVYNDILSGNVKGCSFRFTIPQGGDSWSKDSSGMPIHTVTKISGVSELTITPIPAYAETSVQVMRSLEEFKEKGEINRDMNTENTFKVGDIVKLTASHMPGMEGAIAKIVSVNGSAYEVDYYPTDGSEEVLNHKWVIGSEMEPTTAPFEPIKPEEEADNEPDAEEADKEAKRDDDDDSEEEADNEPIQTTSTTTVKPVSDENGADEQDGEVDVVEVEDGDPDEDSEDEDNSSSSAVNKDEDEKNESKKGEQEMARDLKPVQEAENKEVEIKRDFSEILKNGEIKRDATSGIKLSDGAVIIPEVILAPEKETHQFPRLGNLVRNVSVSTTTGKLPIFMDSEEVLTAHTEFGASQRQTIPEIKPVSWDLASYTSSYAYSQDLLSDSQYDWEGDLATRLQELRDNTDDALIASALTKGVTAVQSTDLIADIKHALNVNLKPLDSASASIVMSQSAFDEIDNMKDDEGRYLVKQDLTSASNYTLLGKTLVVVADKLFPNATIGDVNIVIAPLQKAVVKFKNNEIQGKFVDSYDVYYRILGIYLREDVEQARPDLITLIQKSVATTSTSTSTSTTSK